MKKHNIICIIGVSGSGKTAITLGLQKKYNIPNICSYTTRPKRPGETNGIEHRFVSSTDVPPNSKICAYTIFGNNYEYWTTFDQIEEHPISTYVIDEDGVLYFKEKCKDKPYNIFYIKIERNNLSNIDSSRIQRDVWRTELPDSTYDLILENDGTLENAIDALYIWISENVHIKESIYISIPIANNDWETQKAKADKYEQILLEKGYDVFNPFNIPEPDKSLTKDEVYAYYMGESIKNLLVSDSIILTSGWKKSKGCKSEYELSKIYGIKRRSIKLLN